MGSLERSNIHPILFDREKVALRNHFMLSIDSKLFFPEDVYKIFSLYDQ